MNSERRYSEADQGDYVETAIRKNAEFGGDIPPAIALGRLMNTAIQLMSTQADSPGELIAEWNRLLSGGFKPTTEHEQLYTNLLRGVEGETFDIGAIREFVMNLSQQQPVDHKENAGFQSPQLLHHISTDYDSNYDDDDDNQSSQDEGEHSDSELRSADYDGLESELNSRLRTDDRSSKHTPDQAWAPNEQHGLERKPLEELLPAKVQTIPSTSSGAYTSQGSSTIQNYPPGKPQTLPVHTELSDRIPSEHLYLEPDEGTKQRLAIGLERFQQAQRKRILERFRGNLFLLQQDYNDAQTHDRKTLVGQTLNQWKRSLAELRARDARLTHVAKPFIFISKRFLLAKAFTHWHTTAKMGKEKAELLHRHLVRLNCFGAWLSAAVLEQDALNGFPRRVMMARWKRKIQLLQKRDLEADGANRRRLLSNAFDRWRKEAKLRQAERRVFTIRQHICHNRWVRKTLNVQQLDYVPTKSVTNYTLSRFFYLWRSKTAGSNVLERTAMNWRIYKLQKDAFTRLRLESNSRLFFAEKGWDIVGRMMTKLRLKLAEVKIERMVLNRRKANVLGTILSQTIVAQSRRQHLLNQFRAERDVCLAQQAFDHLRFSAQRRQEDEGLAHQKRCAQLMSTALRALKARLATSRQLNSEAERADFYLTGTKAVSAWRAALKSRIENRVEQTRTERRARLREAYTAVAVPNKRKLGQLAWDVWAGRSKYYLDLNRQAEELVWARTWKTASSGLQLMRAAANELHGLHALADEFDRRRCLKAGLSALGAALRSRLEQAATAASYRQVRDELAVSGLLSRLNYAALQLQALDESMRLFYRRRTERRARALLRFWLDRTSLASPVPVERGGRSRASMASSLSSSRPGPGPDRSSDNLFYAATPRRTSRSLSSRLGLARTPAHGISRSVIRPAPPLDFRASMFLPRDSSTAAPTPTPTPPPPPPPRTATAPVPVPSLRPAPARSSTPAYLQTPSKRAIARQRAHELLSNIQESPERHRFSRSRGTPAPPSAAAPAAVTASQPAPPPPVTPSAGRRAQPDVVGADQSGSGSGSSYSQPPSPSPLPVTRPGSSTEMSTTPASRPTFRVSSVLSQADLAGRGAGAGEDGHVLQPPSTDFVNRTRQAPRVSFAKNA